MTIKKRDKVLERLKPIASAIGIEIDYHDYDNDGREYLTCDGQNICTNSSSLWAIEQEFWGYVTIKKYERSHNFRKHHDNVVKRYWYDKDFKQPWL